MKARKYNNQTGCYKIDLYRGKTYLCSTEQRKTCKEAVERYIKLYPYDAAKGKVTAKYDRT